MTNTGAKDDPDNIVAQLTANFVAAPTRGVDPTKTRLLPLGVGIGIDMPVFGPGNPCVAVGRAGWPPNMLCSGMTLNNFPVTRAGLLVIIVQISNLLNKEGQSSRRKEGKQQAHPSSF
ncbi:hypothetical protein DFS33DRAFT_1293239 [Desarmillaria ectypa]|nr:hypothetical protein DFS33DRAFT_1293239 [Desarmillaria ectypa]